MLAQIQNYRGVMGLKGMQLCEQKIQVRELYCTYMKYININFVHYDLKCHKYKTVFLIKM